MPRRSLAVVFSDFFTVDAEFEAALRLLRFKQCEVILFQVLNEAELEFPYRGRVELRDLESGAAAGAGGGADPRVLPETARRTQLQAREAVRFAALHV